MPKRARDERLGLLLIASSLIEAKILEITLDDNESFGIDWSRTFKFDEKKGTARLGVRDLALAGAPGLFFDLMNSDVEVVISALSDKGRVRTLSTPRLLALEHEEAEVVIGDRLGFRVTTTINEVTTESVEFLESGVILRFTASVDREGRVVLEMHPEVSTGVINDGLPSQNTTEVTTKLVAESGQRIFIAGLIKDRQTDSRTGIPLLGNIPVLGHLFSRSETIDISTETVVLLTARVLGDDVRALSEELLGERAREVEGHLGRRRRQLEADFVPNPLLPDPDYDPGPAEPDPLVGPAAP